MHRSPGNSTVVDIHDRPARYRTELSECANFVAASVQNSSLGHSLLAYSFESELQNSKVNGLVLNEGSVYKCFKLYGQ